MTEISYFLYKLLAEINLGKFTGKSTTDFLGITSGEIYITVSSAYIRIWHRSRTIAYRWQTGQRVKGFHPV